MKLLLQLQELHKPRLLVRKMETSVSGQSETQYKFNVWKVISNVIIKQIF